MVSSSVYIVEYILPEMKRSRVYPQCQDFSDLIENLNLTKGRVEEHFGSIDMRRLIHMFIAPKRRFL